MIIVSSYPSDEIILRHVASSCRIGRPNPCVVSLYVFLLPDNMNFSPVSQKHIHHRAGKRSHNMMGLSWILNTDSASPSEPKRLKTLPTPHQSFGRPAALPSLSSSIASLRAHHLSPSTTFGIPALYESSPSPTSSSSSSFRQDQVSLKKYKAKVCKVEGCQTIQKKYGLCWSHGGRDICKFPLCQKTGKTGGFCGRHGGGKRCSVLGCESIGLKGSLCWKHGGGSRCKWIGCAKMPMPKSSLCLKHQSC